MSLKSKKKHKLKHKTVEQLKDRKEHKKKAGEAGTYEKQIKHYAGRDYLQDGRRR